MSLEALEKLNFKGGFAGMRGGKEIRGEECLQVFIGLEVPSALEGWFLGDVRRGGDTWRNLLVFTRTSC